MPLTGSKTVDSTTEALVLEQFLFYYDQDLSVPEVARMIQIAPKAVRRVVKALRKEKFIQKTRPVGLAQMYQLNPEKGEAVELARFAHERAMAALHSGPEVEIADVREMAPISKEAAATVQMFQSQMDLQAP